jgi:hypothetical protein
MAELRRASNTSRRASVVTSYAARRASIAASYQNGSLREARGSIGGALEAVVLTKQGATFETESGLEEYYKPIPSYEGYHRYDPEYT